MTALKITFLMAICMIMSVLLGGCIAFPSYHPVEVSVRDAETDAPIPNARVMIDYVAVYILNQPKDDAALTNEQGIATLRVSTNTSRYWCASAKGYLGYDESISGAIGGVRSAWMEGTEDHPVCHLYRRPEPHIFIIIPNGYRGPLWIEKRPVPKLIQDQIGKRDFTYRAAPNGYVGIDATPLLMREPIYDDLFRNVVYENHSIVPHKEGQTPPDKIAVRLVSWVSATRLLLVVGTEQDIRDIGPGVAELYKEGDAFHKLDKMIDALFEKARREAGQ